MRTTIVISKNLNLVTKTLSQSRKQIKKYAFGNEASEDPNIYVLSGLI